LLEAGHSDAALTALEGLPATDRVSAEAAYWRARCYEKLATTTYLRLYQADPDSYRLHQLMGDLEAARGDDAKAIEEYRAAIALKPSSPNLHYSLGHLLWKDLKVPEARVELEAELAMNQRHAGALNDLGNTYLLEHQPNTALPYLLKALAANPGSPDTHRDLGTAYPSCDYREAEHLESQFALITMDRFTASWRGFTKPSEREGFTRIRFSTALNRESHDKLEKQTERLGEITKSAEDP
jgi:predicted Zn-dependent protease